MATEQKSNIPFQVFIPELFKALKNKSWDQLDLIDIVFEYETPLNPYQVRDLIDNAMKWRENVNQFYSQDLQVLIKEIINKSFQLDSSGKQQDVFLKESLDSHQYIRTKFIPEGHRMTIRLSLHLPPQMSEFWANEKDLYLKSQKEQDEKVGWLNRAIKKLIGEEDYHRFNQEVLEELAQKHVNKIKKLSYHLIASKIILEEAFHLSYMQLGYQNQAKHFSMTLGEKNTENKKSTSVHMGADYIYQSSQPSSDIIIDHFFFTQKDLSKEIKEMKRQMKNG